MRSERRQCVIVFERGGGGLQSPDLYILLVVISYNIIRGLGMNCIVLGKYYCITFCYCIYCTPQSTVRFKSDSNSYDLSYNRSKGLYFLYTVLYILTYISLKRKRLQRWARAFFLDALYPVMLFSSLYSLYLYFVLL